MHSVEQETKRGMVAWRPESHVATSRDGVISACQDWFLGGVSGVAQTGPERNASVEETAGVRTTADNNGRVMAGGD